MILHHQLYKFFYTKHNWLLAIVIGCFAFGAAHYYNGGERVYWLWEEYSFVPLILSAVGTYGAILWVRIHEQKLRESFEAEIQAKESELQQKINALTKRQQEVFALIAAGKSNKEIAAELFIEQSTLKSHINQVYKSLNLSNRKQAIALAKQLNEYGTSNSQ